MVSSKDTPLSAIGNCRGCSISDSLTPCRIFDVHYRELKFEKGGLDTKLEQAILQCKLYKAKYDHEKVELKVKRENILLQCKLYKAKNNLDKAEFKSERQKAEIAAKRQKQKADSEFKKRKMELESERRRNDLELKYQKFPMDLKSELGNQTPRSRPQLLEKLREWKL
ncbi:hypothetical protein VE03_09419 [Pseudogymnoascus sp. 23342-1-I1]|nr:hypothetical protein VE03_09419 [Pseudogymnoascus sp. 23342-1-I1]